MEKLMAEIYTESKRNQIFISTDAESVERTEKEEQTVIFAKEIPFILKNKNLMDQKQNIQAYIFTGNKREAENGIRYAGIRIGIDEVYAPMYAESYVNSDNQGYAKERHRLIKALYVEYCLKRGQYPNMNEGWYKSEKFKKYMQEIGFINKENDLPNRFNYVLHIAEYEKLQEAIPIELMSAAGAGKKKY